MRCSERDETERDIPLMDLLDRWESPHKIQDSRYFLPIFIILCLIPTEIKGQKSKPPNVSTGMHMADTEMGPPGAVYYRRYQNA
jgi:hypothetical protein